MRKFCDFRSAPILRLGFLGGHLYPKSQHGRRLFAPHHTPTVFLVLRTALHLQRTSLTILLLRLVFVKRLPVLLLLPLVLQPLALRTHKAILLRVVHKHVDRKTILAAVRFARMVAQAADKIDLPPGHLFHILTTGVAPVAHHLLRRLLYSLLHPIQGRQQLLVVIARLRYFHVHHHPLRPIRANLRVIVRGTTPIRLLHLARFRIRHTHPHFFLLFRPNLRRSQFLHLLQRQLQPLLLFSPYPFPRLLLPRVQAFGVRVA